jgi:hypothetical protein
MSDVTKVGNVYLEIRAEIRRLSKDLADAHNVAKQGAAKIQSSIDKGLDFEKMKVKAVAAGAAVYAAFRAVGQAVESARIGSVLEKQAVAFNNLSIAAGTSSKNMISSLKAASQGLVAESDLMAASGKAMLMSIPADKISELMKIAAATSKMTGQSITEAFNDITMGVARQSRMILDNLGIIINVDDANRKYAKTLGTTADALDDAQKRQAFMNAVLESGADMIKRLGSSSGSLDGVNKLIAAQADLWVEVNKTVAIFLDTELTSYANMLNWIAEKLKAMKADKTIDNRDRELKQIEAIRRNEAKGFFFPGSPTSGELQLEWNKKYIGGSEAELGDTAAYDRYKAAEKAARDARFMGSQRVADNQIGYDVEGRWKAYENELKKIEDAAKKAADEIKKLNEEISKLQEDFEDSKIFSGESSNYEKMQAMLRSSYQLSDMETRRVESESESWAKEAEKWNENLMRKVDEYEKAHKKMLDITEETAKLMQRNFSDLFFDVMTGKLKSFEDYARAAFESVARMMSDLLAQQATRQLFGVNGSGGLLSGLFGGGMSVGGVGGAMTGSQLSASQLPINTLAYQPFHSGGVVGSSGGAMRSIPTSYFSTAPRYHAGLMPDEQAAILQKGETVIPKGGTISGGGGNTYYYISAMDTRSIVDSLRRSGAVPMLSEENIRGNGSLRKAIQTRAR